MILGLLLICNGIVSDTASAALLLPRTFGEISAICGDLDGDGQSEFAVGGRNPSAIWIYGGVDGRPLRILRPAAERDQFQPGLAVLEDLDGDGVRDLALAIGSTDEFAGCVELRSGKSDRVIRVLHPVADEVEFGIGLTNVGDVDADGFEDLVVSALLPAAGYEWTGMRWIVYSSAHGKRLGAVEWEGPRTDGWNTARSNPEAFALGCVDADAVPDFAVVDEYRVRAISGADRKTFHAFPLPEQYGKRGSRYCVCGRIDLDCDGRNEIVIGTPYVCGIDQRGPFDFVRAYSGRTREVLRTITLSREGPGFGYGIVPGPASERNGDRGLWVVQHNPFYGGLFVVPEQGEPQLVGGGDLTDHWNFGWSVTGGGDVDGDGTEDFLVACHSPFSAGMWRSGAHVYSGRDRRELFDVRRNSW